MTRHLILIFSFFSILISCKNEKKTITDKEVVSDLIQRYPELAQDTIGKYELKRTIIVSDKKVGIKLYSSDNEYHTPHTIILINNAKGEKYAIPFFSNNARKYWNFENEAKTYKSTTYNSLFEKEFIVAINRLKLNDTLGTGGDVLYEIFHSLLHFHQVTEFDKDYLDDLGRHLINSSAHNDHEIESERRNELNSKQIINDITKTEYILNYNALLDQINYRVFQIDFPKSRHKKIQKLNIKIYRFGQEVIPLEM